MKPVFHVKAHQRPYWDCYRTAKDGEDYIRIKIAHSISSARPLRPILSGPRMRHFQTSVEPLPPVCIDSPNENEAVIAPTKTFDKRGYIGYTVSKVFQDAQRQCQIEIS